VPLMLANPKCPLAYYKLEEEKYDFGRFVIMLAFGCFLGYVQPQLAPKPPL
jgi:hypothetical protein